MANKLQNKFVVMGLAVFCCLLWGSAYPGVKIGYELFNITSTGSKILFAGYRFTLAGILTFFIIRIYYHKWRLPKKNELKPMLILGIVQTTCQYIFFYIGLSNTSGVKGAIINATASFLAIFFAHLVFKNEKLTGNKVVGSILGMAGVIIIQLNKGPIGGGFLLTGEGFLFFACIASALGSVLTRVFSQKIDAMVLTAYQLIFGGLILITTGLVLGGEIKVIPVQGVFLFIYLAFLSATAFSLWTILLKHNPVGNVAIYRFMVPVFGVILSGVFLGEDFLSITTIISVSIVSMGIYIVNREKSEGKVEIKTVFKNDQRK